jgi:hypothetical protein
VRGPDGEVSNILRSQVELNFVGQETTVFRFKLDEQGHLVQGSLNRIHKDLRAAWAKGAGK